MDTENPTPDPDPDPDPDSGGIDVEVSDTQAHLKVDPEAIGRLIRGALEAEGVARASISVALVDDATIRAVNRRHLGHDWPTDVISFGLSGPGDPELSGELVVSAETAVAAAGQAGVSASDEMALYLVHGLLHLCGYDDSTAADRDAIRRREGEILARLGLSNTFHAAAEAGPFGAGCGAEGGGRERERWTV
jgi:probable rRNA maturation factor